MTALPGHVTLFPHQRKAVDELGNGKVLCGDVGVGKTFTALAYWQENEAPRDIYVLTTAKKRDDLDWEAAAAPFSVSAHDGVGVAKITVDSWNNIKKYVDVENAFFILDEQRLVGTGAWTKAFYKIAKNNRWIMLSATPGDVWLDYAPLFIANGWYRNITDFRDQHVIYSYRQKYPKVERYIGEGRLMKYRSAVLVEMPYLRHTTRHIVDICVDYDRDLFDQVVKKRWHPFEERPIRDVAELFHVMRKVAYSHDSRTETVRQLLQKHPKLIVFYNYDYELEALRKLGKELSEACQSQQSLSFSNSSTARATTTTMSTSPSSSSLETEGEPCFENSGACGATTPARSGSGDGGSTSPSRAKSAGYGAVTSARQVMGPAQEGGKGCEPRPKSITSTLGNPGQTGHPTSTAGSQTSSPTPIGSDSTTSFVVQEWNGHKHEPIPTSDSWLYLVQYTAGAEGWNCVETDAMAFYSLNYSYKITHQSMGRIDRLNTPFTDLYYYRLVSNSMIDKAVAASLKDKKKFNEKAFLGNTRIEFPGNR